MLLVETKAGSSRSFVTSAAVHAVLIAVLLMVRFAPEAIEAREWHVALLAPVQRLGPAPLVSAPAPEIERPREFHAPVPAIRSSETKLAVEAPVIAMPRSVAPVLATPKIAATAPVGLAEAKVVPAAAAKLAVQPAGFAAMETGVETHAGVAAKATGAFDIAESARTSTSHVVTASGFSEAAARPVESSRKSIASAAFGDAAVARASAIRTQAAAASATPVEIQFKPKPAYTDDARRIRVEGEVELEVEFQASGRLEVLRVVRGLGHGLDESAMEAARAIRFRPAQADGRAVDSTATIHIVFQLAY